MIALALLLMMQDAPIEDEFERSLAEYIYSMEAESLLLEEEENSEQGLDFEELMSLLQLDSVENFFEALDGKETTPAPVKRKGAAGTHPKSKYTPIKRIQRPAPKKPAENDDIIHTKSLIIGGIALGIAAIFLLLRRGHSS